MSQGFCYVNLQIPTVYFVYYACQIPGIWYNFLSIQWVVLQTTIIDRSRGNSQFSDAIYMEMYFKEHAFSCRTLFVYRLNKSVSKTPQNSHWHGWYQSTTGLAPTCEISHRYHQNVKIMHTLEYAEKTFETTLECPHNLPFACRKCGNKYKRAMQC